VRTKDQVAQLIVGEAKKRQHTRQECLAEMSTLYQESGWDETVWDPTHTTYGIAQQDDSYPNRMNGAPAQIAAFFDRLDTQRAKPGASTDIWLNICWLQQAPNWPSAQYWWEHGRRAYLTEIKSRVTTVTPYLDKHWPTTTGGTMPGFTGDPTWLEQVLRADLGDRLVVHDGWQDRGTGSGPNGQMGDIWGVMIHHTGNSRETWEHIRDGRDDLPGPLSHCLITPDGKCHLIAIGPCNHAGIGDYGPLHDDGNQRLIAFECAWPTIRPDGSYDSNERWPDAQIITMRDATAAVLRRLDYDSSRVIGHKDYAGARQGKWDPGNIDMAWFRGEVQKDLNGYKFPGEDKPDTPAPGPALPPDYAKEVWDLLRSEHDELGGRTVIGALAELLKAKP
jgi:hypothetical protein